jgi:hypothetical protein
MEVFPNLATVVKIYMTLPITSCEAERNIHKISELKEISINCGKD